MAEEKKIAILLKQPPHGTLYPVEGLRMSVALSGDYEPVTLVIKDAVFTFLKDSDRTMAQPHIDFLKGIGLDIILDKQALEERGISQGDLIDGLVVKEHEEIITILGESDVVVPF